MLSQIFIESLSTRNPHVLENFLESREYVDVFMQDSI